MSAPVALKPCPFCGAPAVVVDRLTYLPTLVSRSRWKVSCTACVIAGNYDASIFAASKATAVRNWNRRADAKGGAA